jgi:hypothetical protein
MRIRLFAVFAGLAGILLACMVFCQAVSAAQAPEIWQYTLPDAKIVAGLDWQRARTSAAGRMLAKQFGMEAGKWKAMGPGAELLDCFDRVLLSSRGDPGATPLLVLQGRVDRATLKKSMPPGTGVERFKGVDLYLPPNAGPNEMLVASVDESTVLMGQRATIAEVLDDRQGLHDAALLDRAKQMALQCDFWILADAPPASAAGDLLPKAKGMEDVQAMDLGLSLQKGLGLQANLKMTDVQKAQGMAMLTQMMASMASNATDTPPEIARIIRGLQVSTVGPVVRMSLDIPLAQLERGVAQLRAGITSGGRKTLESMLGLPTAGANPVPGVRPAANGLDVPPPPPPPVPQKRTIRIVGAEGGDKEITYTTGGK